MSDTDIAVREAAVKVREDAVSQREQSATEREKNFQDKSADVHFAAVPDEEIHPNDVDDASKGEHVAKWIEGKLQGEQRVKICSVCGKTVKL